MTKLAGKCFLPLVTMAVFSGSSWHADCQSSRSENKEEVSLTPSVGSLAQHPDKYLNNTVRLAGRLENEGKNYFTDLRVVLRDAQGNRVYVRPWLPAELPPSPPGYTGKKPQVLSQYLGKEVELTAVVERGTLKNVGEVYLLNVKSAKVVR